MVDFQFQRPATMREPGRGNPSFHPPKVREIGGREFVQVSVRSLLRPFQKLTLTEGFQFSSARVLQTTRFGIVQELFDSG